MKVCELVVLIFQNCAFYIATASPILLQLTHPYVQFMFARASESEMATCRDLATVRKSPPAACHFVAASRQRSEVRGRGRC